MDSSIASLHYCGFVKFCPQPLLTIAAPRHQPPMKLQIGRGNQPRVSNFYADLLSPVACPGWKHVPCTTFYSHQILSTILMHSKVSRSPAMREEQLDLRSLVACHDPFLLHGLARSLVCALSQLATFGSPAHRNGWCISCIMRKSCCFGRDSVVRLLFEYACKYEFWRAKMRALERQ
jgi:hypothetical protein